MSDFKLALEKEIKKSLKNNFGIENYDEYRFGEYPIENRTKGNVVKKRVPTTLFEFKKVIKKIIGYNPDVKLYISAGHNLIMPYEKELTVIWNSLNTTDRKLLISLLAYRILGYKKVKLPRNNKAYWEAIEIAKSLSNPRDTYVPNFLHFVLEKFDLKPIGYEAKFYFSEIGIAIDYIIEQYAYKIDNKHIVCVERGDTVLDIGGCWGDTALYFANKVGDVGKVYSFEFIPDNIKLFNINTSLNPSLLSRIQLVPNPVSNISDQKIYFKDNGPGSSVMFEPFDEQTGTALTTSIDDFVASNNIDCIDFIKMDIEGAETFALEGAIETIKKFRPKLAIAIYHSMNDFVTIPNWILNLNLDYEIFIGHYTIHAEETICFAKPRSKK